MLQSIFNNSRLPDCSSTRKIRLGNPRDFICGDAVKAPTAWWLSHLPTHDLYPISIWLIWWESQKNNTINTMNYWMFNMISYLLGGWATYPSEKWWTSSVGMIIPNRMESHKNSCSKPPISRKNPMTNSMKSGIRLGFIKNYVKHGLWMIMDLPFTKKKNYHQLY